MERIDRVQDVVSSRGEGLESLESGAVEKNPVAKSYSRVSYIFGHLGYFCVDIL